MSSMSSVEHHIWFLAWPGIQALDLVGPHEVFAAANHVADGLDRTGPRYRLRVITVDGSPIVSESGLTIAADRLPPGSDRPDTLIIPGGDGVHKATTDPETLQATRSLGSSAPRLATVCTGTFLAAAAGLLDGRRVATHWARAKRLASAYPMIEVDDQALHVQDGNVWSSAGVTAGIDLGLAMVEYDHDAEVAQITGRWLVVHLRRPGGQSQFAAPVWTDPSPIEPIRRAQELIQASPGSDHAVTTLAREVGLSPRHLTRLFRSELGETPARFVEQVRVDAARRELESSGADLATVAGRCGFGSGETLRRAFHRRLGLSPDEYRRRFRLQPTA